MKYYLIAGETSGDMHGASLMAHIRALDSQAIFRYIGGSQMLSQGGSIAMNISELNFMGFAEVLKNLKTIRANLRFAQQDILAFAPDVLVLIDFPGFNLRIAKIAHTHGIKVAYYISPKVWAWNSSRVHQIKKYVNKLFVILPFEAAWYSRHGVHPQYVGNPVVDQVSAFRPDPYFPQKNNITRPVIALLPGSRKQEVDKLLPVMLSIIPHFPGYQFVIAGTATFNRQYYAPLVGNAHVTVVQGETYNLLTIAQAAVVASGTATLETALFSVPQVVVYKGHWLSVLIGGLVLKIKFISLVNLIMNKKVVRELIQDKLHTEHLTSSLQRILPGGKARAKMLADYAQLKAAVGGPGASQATAAGIVVLAQGSAS